MNSNAAPKAYFGPEEENTFLEAEVSRVRKMRGRSADDDLVGLALSGGGIRSASFALGVLQAMAKEKVFDRIDYLSTVSGGGYIGSSLTWFRHNKWAAGAAGDPLGTSEDRTTFPIGEISDGVRSDVPNNIRAAILRYIRQHGNYLIPTNSLNFISLISVVLRSVFLSFSVYFSLLTLLLLALSWIGGWLAAWVWPQQGAAEAALEDLAVFLSAALDLLIIFLFICIVYSLFTFTRLRVPLRRYRARIWVQRGMGWLWTLIVLFALVGSLPFISKLLDVGAASLWETGLVGGLSAVLGFAGAFLDFLKETAPGGRGKKPSSGLVAFLVAALLLYGLLLLAYDFAGTVMPIWPVAWLLSFGIALAVYALAVGLIVNLNYISLHRMYRDRLMETFLPNEGAIEENRWRPAIEADHTLLEDLAGNATRGPYHLINTNAVLIDATHSKYRGRGGDNFILAPLYCGSHATGWRQTNVYMKNPFSRGMTLSTAMAISGAAINPDTGVAGKGITRNRIVSFLMTVLNVRLGYWAPNPRYKGNLIVPPNYFVPGFKGLRGKGFDETSFFLELTDGGHFENIGIYELIRRRAKIIIVSDAAADPDFRFSDFGNAVERVRVDFGVNIRFRDESKDLRGIMPGSAKKNVKQPESEEAFRRMYDLAERGYAIGEIEYPPKGDDKTGTTGKIVYVKSTLTKELPADIYGYKSAHPSFPDEATSDQFFDENQFEAYRELGYRLTCKVPWKDVLPPPSGKKQPDKKTPKTQG